MCSCKSEPVPKCLEEFTTVEISNQIRKPIETPRFCLYICRYEREEAFLALNLTVKNATLQDSLDQFVKGELLEGDNAYFCDKCGEKVHTI